MRIQRSLNLLKSFTLPQILLAVFVLMGCGHSAKTVVLVAGGKFSRNVLTKDEIPKKFDLSRTYYYYTNPVRPDSLLDAISRAGFKVHRAWYCDGVHYYCMDTVGPHFTIELEAADPRILEHGFTSGVGKIWCASELDQYETTD